MSLATPLRCSALADELAEPMIGSVDHRVRWLLVEDHSAWGEHAVRDVLGADLEAAAKERRMRLLLVRRREGDPVGGAVPRAAFLVDTGTGEMATRSVRDLSELWPLLDATLAEFGSPVLEPLVLVCTNGRRDACCALRGRALVSALSASHAERTWECTHLGGHRFAGNLVCLPDGIVYGRVGATDGPRLVDAYLERRLDPAFLRGRSAWPAPAQVAEQALRAAHGLDAIDAVGLDSVAIDGDRATVELRAEGGLHRVDLEVERLEPPRAISCRADELKQPRHWRISAGPAPAPGTR